MCASRHSSSSALLLVLLVLLVLLKAAAAVLLLLLPLLPGVRRGAPSRQRHMRRSRRQVRTA
jgi:hypothetical protein